VFNRQYFSAQYFPAVWFAPLGQLVEFPQYVATTWPEWTITEQVERASHGMLHLAMARRAAIRRGR
jgi:hypothetical protein